MKVLNYRNAVVFLLLLLSVAPLSGCGSSGGSSSSGDQAGNSTGSQPTTSGSTSEIIHSVPEWIIGSWQVIRLRTGLDETSQNMFLTVTDTGFEYHYPGCDVYGLLEMDKLTPYFASNNYRLLMTSANGVCLWDIPSFDGATDEGHVWEDIGKTKFFRKSDLYGQFTWQYVRQ